MPFYRVTYVDRVEAASADEAVEKAYHELDATTFAEYAQVESASEDEED